MSTDNNLQLALLFQIILGALKIVETLKQG